MIAIETSGTIDEDGFLTVEKPILRNQKVRVLVLLPEDNDNAKWLQAVSSNPASEFLADEAEDLYSLQDGFDLDNEK